MRLIHVYMFILAYMLSASPVLFAQEEGLSAREKRKLQRQEKKEQREKERKAIARLNNRVIEDRRFVLEADRLYNRYGQSAYVSSNLNFILVDSTHAVIQIGSPTGMGANGVGGVTAEGRITRYEINRKDDEDIQRVNMSVSTSLGLFDVRFFISSGTSTSAELSSSVRGGNLTFSGVIKPLQAARVYQGHTSY